MLSLLTACSSKKEHTVTNAFYYWKTNFNPDSAEKALLRETNAGAIYLRLFDVDWNPIRQKALPVGIVQVKEKPAQTIVPVVYITQACLDHLKEQDVPELAGQIGTLISGLCHQFRITPAEVQIDCDWTKTNAPVYFALLRQLKSSAFIQDKMLSCTIRLHQVKFASSSGVPPVDKGLLMVYNMGNLTRYGGHNSILETGEAKSYLRHLSTYTLPLDVALPVYHWAVLFEQKAFKGITYNLTAADFKRTDLEPAQGNLYQVMRDTFTAGYRFKKGQEIRFEQPDKSQLKEVGAFINEHIRDSSFQVIYFHLDSKNIQPFTAADLNEISCTFR
ncbi:MAG: hypothetical protein EOP49_13685 [Sphingobacteriales bacterium]|nr:MAG: hypothetical protein EOP49_13685 [Sphingobacteriales bacterium]